MNTSDVLYFGCWQSTGHHLHDTKGGRVNYDRHPLASVLDSGLLKMAGVPDTGANVGHVFVTRIGTTWTILSFWDRSVDSRPGSNGNFVFPGVISYHDAMEWARQAFPHVFARYSTFERCLVAGHKDYFEYPEANDAAGN